MSEIETHAGYIRGDKKFTFDTGDQKWIRRLYKWKEKFPDDVVIVSEYFEPENTSGVVDIVVAELPIKWFKISPTGKRILTDEQRRAISERFKKNKGGSLGVELAVVENFPPQVNDSDGEDDVI